MTQLLRRKLIRNRVRCVKCDTVLESRHRHDFRSCPCGNFIDGGLSYVRAGLAEGASFEDLSEWEHEYQEETE